MQICFVCTGNTCRSPFAEKLFKKMLKENGLLGISVSSCGVNIVSGSKTSQETIDILKTYGINFKGKRAQKLTKTKLNSTHLFITMTKDLKAFVPAKNVYSLGELAGGEDVVDPYGGDFVGYEYMAKQICEYLKVLIYKIKNIKEMQ